MFAVKNELYFFGLFYISLCSKYPVSSSVQSNCSISTWSELVTRPFTSNLNPVYMWGKKYFHDGFAMNLGMATSGKPPHESFFFFKTQQLCFFFSCFLLEVSWKSFTSYSSLAHLLVSFGMLSVGCGWISDGGLGLPRSIMQSVLCKSGSAGMWRLALASMWLECGGGGETRNVTSAVSLFILE